MNKILAITILLLLSCSVTFAQDRFDNSVKLNMGGFSVPKVYSDVNFSNQLGAVYERRVFKDLYVSAGYQQWYRWAHRKVFRGYSIEQPYWLNDIFIGKLTGRHNYKMLDVSVLYKYHINKKHIISGGLGASYCWGENAYVKHFYIHPLDIVFSQYSKDVQYWGIVPQLSYDYLFLKNRLSAGVDLRARYYGSAFTQYDYGVHVGVNF